MGADPIDCTVTSPPGMTSSRSVGISVLAAGSSTRLGRPKQLLHLGGETLIRRAVREALSAGFPVTVIIGSEAAVMRQELEGLPVTPVENAKWQEGIASSIRCAVRQLEVGAEGILIMTVDQVRVTAGLLKRLAAAFETGSVSLVACRYAGTVGVPALYDRSLFPELLSLTGDAGAKSVIERHLTEAQILDFPEGAVDIDSAEELAEWASGGSQS